MKQAKNKEPFKKRFVRFCYSVKGWFMERKMKVGEYYVSEYITNRRMLYRGNRTFYVAFAASPCPGVVYTDQRKKQYKYWEIGVLNFKKC